MAALTTKPAPALVQIHREKLVDGAEKLRYWLAMGILLQFRTAVVWGFLALFFPGLGITWFMVMFGLWAIRHLMPPNSRRMVENIAAQRQ
jgi:hypothetical protein